MMKTYLTALFALMLLLNQANAQGVGVNPNGNQPHASSMLDVESTNKGVLIPRLALTATNVATPVAAPATSLLVYNTATAGTGATEVTPGFYYWDGTQWVRMVAGPLPTSTDDQNLTGATLTGNTLQIDIENGASASVDLSGLQDGTGTDDQNLSMSTALDSILIEDGTGVSVNDVGTGLTANNSFVNNLGDSLVNNTNLVGNIYDSITNNGTWIDQLQDSINTDDQNLSMSTALDSILIEDGTGVSLYDVGTGLTANNSFINNLGDSLVNNTNLIGNIYDSITNNGAWIDQLQDSINTDDQTLSLTGTNLSIENGNTVDLSGLQDGTGTDDQNLTGATLTGNTLQIDIENGTSASVDLSGLQDGTGTDDQNLTLTGTDLSIENGNTVDLSGLQDGTGTDDQNLTGATLTGNTLQIDIENGTSTSVDLSGLQDGTGTDDQNLTLTGTDLSIENGNTIDLSALAGGNDAWKLTGNAGTTAGTNFIGTTDNQDVVFKRNNVRGGLIHSTNTAFGVDALLSNSNGYGGVAFGAQALRHNVNASGNTAIGFSSLDSNIVGIYNTACGYNSMVSNEFGHHNVSVGYSALAAHKTGSSNIALGSRAMSSSVGGNGNIAIGLYALDSNTTGGSNIALGQSSLRRNKNGAANIALGHQSLMNNSSGHSNISFGSSSLVSNTIGAYNTAIGPQALDHNINGNDNIAIGESALHDNISGNSNIALGDRAAFYNDDGLDNVAIGRDALSWNRSGDENLALGRRSFRQNQSGSQNTVLGAYAASGTGSSIFNNSTSIGYDAEMLGSNEVMLGNTTITSVSAYAAYTNLSDARFKVNVKENVPGLDFITQLRPVTYNLDITGLNFFLGKPDSLINKEAVVKKESLIQTGFIAQEVENVAQSLNYCFSGVDAPQNEKDHYGLRYAEFVVPLVKAIQEQQDLIENLQNEIVLLSIQNEVVTKELEALKYLVKVVPVVDSKIE